MEVSGPTPGSEGAASPATPQGPVEDDAGTRETREQIRGSSILLGGRMVSLALNLVTQVLIVRSLTQSDFGAFAYGLTLVALGRTLVTLGHNQTITRFFAIYSERRQYNKLFGTLVMEVGIAVSLGLALFAGVFGLQGWLAGSLDADAARVVLVVLVLLAPVEAINALIEGMFAVLARPAAIFVRKYVLAPLLRLAVVLLLLVTGGSVLLLAVGYVLAGVVGLLIYASMLRRVLREGGLWAHFRLREVSMPVREVFGFSFPLLTTELANLSMSTVSVLLLGYFHDAKEVGALRVILPAATLNMVVSRSFALLFMPLAARLYAREDADGMRHAYTQTVVWLAILSFPIFVVTCALAEPTTVLLFGERYRDSSTFLALMALGYYFNAALGFNALTLQVFGRLRWIVGVNVSIAVLNITLVLSLVPRLGALGVALAHAVTLIVQNLLNQVGLVRLLGMRGVEPRYAGVYISLVLVGSGTWLAAQMLEPDLLQAAALAVVSSALVLVVNRRALHLGSTFPEVAKVPVLGRFLA